MKLQNLIEIDGSYKSAGGQILRTALALSAITQKPFSISNIRKSRPNPGLQEQHLQAVNSLVSLTNAEIEGNKLHSTSLTFIPKKIEKKKLNINIRTAGSTALLLQSLLVAGTKHNLEINIDGGGTFNKFATSIPYYQYTLLPLLKRMNYDVKIEILKHGFYPKGGAKLKVITKKTNLKPLNLEKRGKLLKSYGFSYASNSLKLRKVAERQSNTAKKLLKDYQIKIKNIYVDSLCPGSGIVLVSKYDNTLLGYDSLGELGKPAEKVGEEAALGLLKQINSKATVDIFMSDQILPYLALCNKPSVIKIPELTEHAETNLWLIKKFLNRNFRVEDSLIKIEL